MDIQYGKGKTKYGPGVQINLTGNEVAIAIYAYLMAHNVVIDGAATITVNGEVCQVIGHLCGISLPSQIVGEVYVDPSGRVIADEVEWNGRGHKE